MAEDSVVRFHGPGTVEDPMTELLRRGARRLIQRTLDATLAMPVRPDAERPSA